MHLRNLAALLLLCISFEAAAAPLLPSISTTGKKSVLPYSPPPRIPNPYHPLGDFQFLTPIARSIAAVDLNADGKNDFIVAPSYFSHQPRLPIQVWINSGDGTFTDGTTGVIDGTIPSTGFVTNVFIEDFNGDGQPDVFMADQGLEDSDPSNPGFTGGLNTVLLSQPNGKLRDTTSTSLAGQLPRFNHVSSMGDVNGDGRIDVVLSRLGGPAVRDVGVVFLLNNGSGVFIESIAGLPATVAQRDGNLGRPAGLDFQASGSNTVADLDGDGTMDLVTGSYKDFDWVSRTRTLRIHAQSISGAFSEVRRYEIPSAIRNVAYVGDTPTSNEDGSGLGVSGIHASDLNSDGRRDLVVLWEGAFKGYLQILRNDGNFNFTDVTSDWLGQYDVTYRAEFNSGVAAVRVADLNGDGYSDLDLRYFGSIEFAGMATGATAWLNDGTGKLTRYAWQQNGITLTASQVQSAFSNLCQCVGGNTLFADVDGDGIDDLVVLDIIGGSTYPAQPAVQRTIPVMAFKVSLNARQGGFRDQTLTGLRALPNARFEAHGLVAPSTSQVSLNSAESAGSPWGTGASTTVIRTLAAGAAARDWRVLVDARTASGGDLDLYLGIDSNNNGQADASELACSGATGTGAQRRCDLALTAPADGSVRYWVLVRGDSIGQVAQLDLFETPLDVPVANRRLVATGPGSLAANATFDVRLSWSDPTFLPGQSRGGWVHVRADENTSARWVPVRIDRSAGDAAAFALKSGIDHALALAPSTARERLYLDVPPGATRLDVTTASSSNIDLYLARVEAPVASGATPTIAPAPARNLASSSATTPSGNESLTVNNPAPGRWYVTPVNASGATADVVIRATLTGTGPQLRSGGFFNPSRSGNGLFVYPAGSEWAALWYTYLQDGSPTWYYMQGAAPGPSGIWRGSIFRSAWNGSSNRLTVVGEATITPTATNAFTFSYTVDGEVGSEAYSTFSGACPSVNGAPLDISGHWFDPSRSGSGYSVQSFPNYEFYLVFGYDAQGVPRYLVAERSDFGGVTETLTLEQLRGVCPLCTRTGNPQRTSVGTLQRRIDGGTLRNITLSAAYVNGVPGTWAANDAVIPLGNLRGCAL